ncbi:MAG: SLC13 family permease [Bacteroidetes bacterium]|jgi:di/tricarboxylate transporter|nr:SLC13 family permease [Bacteroidota bacterium]
MTADILIVFGLLVVALVLFAWERVSYDVTAVLIMSTLLVTGILTPQEGLAGFSNTATATIAAMFVLSASLRQTGALNEVGDFFRRLGEERSPRTAVIIMMLTVGIISAFINNTAAIAIFIPIVLTVAADLKESPSKLLMPISFASMFGGVCTLIGTSTNILVSSIATDRGLEPFSVFEFAPLGIIFFIAGFAYLLTMGIHLIPERRTGSELTADFRMNAYLTDVIVEPSFAHIGKPLRKTPLTDDLDLDVLQVFSQDGDETRGRENAVIEAEDVLRVRGSIEEISKLLRREDLSLRTAREWYDADLERGAQAVVEAVIAPDSALEGEAIGKVDFMERFGAIVLAIRHQGRLQQEDLSERRLSGGDSILLSMDQERVPELERDPSFVVVSEIGLPRERRGKMPLALTVLVGVVATAALGLVPIVVSAIVGCVVLVLTRCLTPEEAYEAINWKVIFLLAGVIPLGTAMDKSGAADLISTFFIDVLGPLGPMAILSGFFFVSMMLTNVVSNQATAALLAPIAIQAADLLGVEAKPFLLAVTYAASLSFMTPIGYQTNTLIYGPGQYKFTDFTRVGTPLNLLFWLLATLLIPVIWSF